MAFVFCYFAVLPIWRFALPSNYVASCIVFLGLLFVIIGVFIARPDFTLPAVTTFTIPIGPIWPIMLVLTGWWQYLWVLFGGANQLMASLALMLVSRWISLGLISEGKSATWACPMTFMFFTTIAALIYTSCSLLTKVFTGTVKGFVYGVAAHDSARFALKSSASME